MFTVAKELGCWVCDLEENMPPDEFAEWIAYFRLVREAEEKEISKQKRGAKSVPPSRIPRSKKV
mgnify:CR=1 FL=1